MDITLGLSKAGKQRVIKLATAGKTEHEFIATYKQAFQNMLKFKWLETTLKKLVILSLTIFGGYLMKLRKKKQQKSMSGKLSTVFLLHGC